VPHLDVQLLGFITASVIIIVVPGVDFALVTRQVVRYGRRIGFVTLAGLVVGGLVHATLATVGISALVLSSETLYTALRFAGALYLLYIGGITLWATRPRRGVAQPAGQESRLEPAAASPARAASPGGPRKPPATVGAGPARAATRPVASRPAGAPSPAVAPASGSEATRAVHRRAFGMGITSNLLNPKVIILYVSFVPQFVPAGPAAPARTALLAGLFITLAVVWWVFYILAISRLHGWLTRPRVNATIERLTGVVLIAFAVKLALGY
jgi:threonine/homoserine/homoserine lactone efflux protein